jgi:HEPN domain-containing protein
MKQTAVEWLRELSKQRELDKFDWEQAKEMHKQEIENAFVECWKANMPDGYECKLSAEQYYNETFKQN